MVLQALFPGNWLSVRDKEHFRHSLRLRESQQDRKNEVVDINEIARVAATIHDG
jgi:hypothetical protein